MKKPERAVIVVVAIFVLMSVGIQEVGYKKIEHRKSHPFAFSLLHMILVMCDHVVNMDQAAKIRIWDKAAEEHVKGQYLSG